ncbi:hypothetical protein NN561_018742 [Cricetulus griseus]
MPEESGKEREAKTTPLGPGPQEANGTRPEPPGPHASRAERSWPGPDAAPQAARPTRPSAAQPRTLATHLYPLTQVAARPAEQWRKDDVRSAFPTPGSAQQGSETHPIDAEML